MTHSDLPKLVKMVHEALAYYRQDVSEFTMRVWTQACQDYTLEQVSQALMAHATDAEKGQFAPKVSDLVRILAGTTTDRAVLAWGKLLGAMSAVGAYSDVAFDDPAIHAAIEDCGGWIKCCRGEISELSYLQHRFCQSYKAYVRRGTFDFQGRLIGDRSPDSSYLKKGLPVPQPALVGDKEAALAVMRNGSADAKTKISFGIEKGIEQIQKLKLGELT